ncbi:DUF6779 domain-containing protein [Kutzneria sp. CA-103260]|uniref:DUF6779 domain-containing protein n=1 Tax=Kutzneria sp. CA-103260 TaxID=2802641 RepID=UPI001BA79013|nr:DUF6779 domain-containing protein [Kutzneria sp. CA-103260]QUQ69667.1 hypothetical protein JJ691_74270 [Kutzneria sp. CA-103260]
MTGRSGLTEGERGDSRGYGRLLLVAVLVLAIAATAVLVLSNDARFLRLGVLAALWAALVGAFLAVKYRREAAASEDEVADLQAVYELELEREVAARREYELEIEADTRRRVEEESREDLDALRGELRALRENLEALLGGEVLVERVALRAESTRMRSLSDQSRLLAVGEDRLIASAKEERKPITVGTVRKEAAVRKEAPADKSALPTEMIERIAHELPRKDQASRRPEPSRPEQARQPVRTAQTDALSRPATPPRREPQRPAQPAATQFVSRPGAAKPGETRPAERRPEPRQPEPRKPEARPTGIPNVVGARVRPPEPVQPVSQAMSQPLSQPMAQPSRAPEPREPRRPEPRQPEQRSQPAQRTEQTMAMRLNPEMKQPPAARQPEAPRPAETSGRRRRPEADAAVAPETTGRRRRPEPEPAPKQHAAAAAPPADPAVDGPVWDPELGDWVPNSLELPIPVRTGPAVTPPPAPAAPPPPPAAPAPPAVDTGAHAAGKSVSELLASLGQEEPRGRRRRRADD